jgi:hypothetical protein
VAQIVTGILLAMHFQASSELGFLSVEHASLKNLIFYNKNQDLLNNYTNRIEEWKDITVVDKLKRLAFGTNNKLLDKNKDKFYNLLAQINNKNNDEYFNK